MPAIVPPALFGCVLTTGPGRPTGPGPHAAHSTAHARSRADASFIIHLNRVTAARRAPSSRFRRLAEDFDDGGGGRAGIAERMSRTALQVEHLSRRDLDRLLSLDGHEQLAGHQRE